MIILKDPIFDRLHARCNFIYELNELCVWKIESGHCELRFSTVVLDEDGQSSSMKLYYFWEGLTLEFAVPFSNCTCVCICDGISSLLCVSKLPVSCVKVLLLSATSSPPNTLLPSFCFRLSRRLPRVRCKKATSCCLKSLERIQLLKWIVDWTSSCFLSVFVCF